MSANKQNPLRMIGAFAPSTARLADAMTRFVSPDIKNILEVGAGTGAITKSLVKKMIPSQTAEVVEIFPGLSRLLQMRFGQYPSIAIHCTDIMHFEAKAPYDLIISSLPFNAFLPDLTQAVIDRLIALAKPGAYFSFFEYKILQGMMPFVMPKTKLEQFYGSRAIIEQFIARYQFDEEVVNFNIPPAVVHHLRINKP
jgi:phospholipid N-methyltransferase